MLFHTKKYKYILFVALIALSLSSCKTKKKIFHTTSPIEAKENSQLFSDILSNAFTYSSFESKITLNLSSGKHSVGSKAQLRIRHNEAIQISIQPLWGVEMFRFHMDKDTLVLLDRMNKRYVKEALTDIKKSYPVGFDFYTLQALLTNRIFLSQHAQIMPNDYHLFHYTQGINNYFLKTKDTESEIEYSFSINAADQITFTNINLQQSTKSYSLIWEYTDFSMVDKKLFPHKMNITAGTLSKKIDASILFNNITLNEPIDFRNHIPTNYSKASLSSIIKIITGD